MACKETTPEVEDMKKQIVIECLAARIVELKSVLTDVYQDCMFNVGPSQGTKAKIMEALGVTE